MRYNLKSSVPPQVGEQKEKTSKTMFSDIGTGRLETNFKDDKRAHNFAAATRIAIFISVGLLSTAGGLTGNPDKAKTQALLSKIAYFEFAIVIVALTGACLYLYFKQRHTIKPSQVIVSSPRLMLSQFQSPQVRVLANI